MSDWEANGARLYQSMYGGQADEVQRLLDTAYPDMGKTAVIARTTFGVSLVVMQAGFREWSDTVSPTEAPIFLALSRQHTPLSRRLFQATHRDKSRGI